MSLDRESLSTLLKNSRSKAVTRILSDPLKPLQKGDLRRIESIILARERNSEKIAELFDLVRKIAIEAGTHEKFLKQSGIVIRYPAPKNPFAAQNAKPPIAEAEQVLAKAAIWLKARHSKETHALRFYKFLVAAILDCRVLHLEFVPAILRSLLEGRVVDLEGIKAIPLSLNYGRQQNSERRVLILRGRPLVYFNRFGGAAGAKALFSELGLRTSGFSPSPDSLAERLRKAALPGAKNANDDSDALEIPKLIESARVMAMLQLPSVIVAHRSRQIVSHSLPPEILGRIAGMKLDAFALKRIPTEEADDPGLLEPQATYDEPDWMGTLRLALDPEGLNMELLDQLAQNRATPAGMLARFATFLATRGGQRRKAKENCNAATVRRYCLLIAAKLIPRLTTDIPSMTDDAWDDAIEQLLDEDAFYNLERYTAHPKSSAQAHSRPLVTAIRHWLRFVSSQRAENKGDLAELEKRLPVLGLVAVDASLITVDEYLRALGRMVGGYGPDGEEEREVGRVGLILGYRCGMRRREAAGLSVSDFDSIDYLHVRANEMRKLKTSNARRDLPLRLLMPDTELRHVQKRVEAVRKHATANSIPLDRAYVFSLQGAPVSFEAVVKRIHRAFRGDRELAWDAIDKDFHYHRLRHSFCNLTLLRLWPALGETAARFFPGEQNARMRDWIRPGNLRQQLFGTEVVTEGDLQGIALLMGHGSAAVSLEHYTHVLDFYEPPRGVPEQEIRDSAAPASADCAGTSTPGAETVARGRAESQCAEG